MRFLLAVLSFWMLEYSLSSDLECSFSYDVNGFYTCMTMNFKLVKENASIDLVKGQHLSGKTNINVQGFLVTRSNNKFISSDFFEKFHNLKVLSVMQFSVEKIVQGNFKGAQNLKKIFINNNVITQLSDNIFSGAPKLIRIEMKMNGINTISNKTFAGLTTLQHIDLDHNHLKSLPKGIFDDLINVQYLSLYGNILESVDGDLFKNNLLLTFVSLSNNHLTVIGSNLITHLKSLKIANFNDNLCISTSLNNLKNSTALIDEIAKCTESNKPEQKLRISESEKNQCIGKIDSINKANLDKVEIMWIL